MKNKTKSKRRKSKRRVEKNRRVNPYIRSIPDLRNEERRSTNDRRKDA